MTYNSFVYSVKVWLTAVIIAPVLYTVIFAAMQAWNNAHQNITETLSLGLLFMVYGAVFSLITWVVFFLIVIITVKACSKTSLQKPIISFIGVLLTIGTFKLFIYPEVFVFDEMFYLVPCNCICIAGASLFFKLQEKTTI